MGGGAQTILYSLVKLIILAARPKDCEQKNCWLKNLECLNNWTVQTSSICIYSALLHENRCTCTCIAACPIVHANNASIVNNLDIVRRPYSEVLS